MKPSARRPIGPVALIVCLSITPSARGTTWYVDADATTPAAKVCSGDGVTPCDTVLDCPEPDVCACPAGHPTCGKSWCTAFTNLQDGLDAAITGDTVLVADGTYPPDPTGLADGREATFQLPQTLPAPDLPALNVMIQGGYAGCGAADPFARDLILFETVLSGDLDGDDDPEGPAGPDGTCCQSTHPAGCDDETCETAVCAVRPTCCSDSWTSPCRDLARNLCCNLCGANVTRCENSYHVVTGTGTHETVTFDGFTITGGNAVGRTVGEIPRAFGGGYVSDARPPNAGLGSAKLVACTLEGNTASRGGGGAATFNSTDPLNRIHPNFTDCIFRSNVSAFSGGGVFNGESDATFMNCLFENNSATTSWGGAMYSDGGKVRVLNSSVVGNFARPSGGGLYFDGVPFITITDTILWGNATEFASVEPSQIATNDSFASISFTAIEGCKTAMGGLCDASTTNSAADPLFVPGPLGCYYLSQVAAGEPEDSPALDAGNDTAANLGFDDLVTTRSDEAEDLSTVDLGYHHPVSGLGLVFGDYDRDDLTTLDDYFEFTACFTGMGPVAVPPCCRIFDDVLDRDVDLEDFAAFQRSFSEP